MGESYKKMCESLKNKIRELSSKDGDSKDFMDSFEEVMQDEMYTMKLAFEAKLKCKSDEVAALAQRHALEISRIQASSSPYAGDRGTRSSVVGVGAPCLMTENRESGERKEKGSIFVDI